MPDIIGKKFGRLTVLSFYRRKDSRKYYECICECGNKWSVRSDSLKSGHTQSCGCYNKDILHSQKNRLEHGMSRTRLHNVWMGMIARCHSEKDQAYKNYGARGIKVCDEWKEDFMNFYTWAHANGYKENLTIERVDNDGNYEPSNCTWIPRSEQSKNRRSLRYLTIDGQTKTVSEWARYKGIQKSTIYRRMKRGLKGKDLVTKQVIR